MDDNLGYIIWSFTNYYFVYLGILDIVDDHADTYRVYEYTPQMDLDSLSLVRRIVFQFWALAEMIWLNVPFWCSFAIPDGLSEQGDDLLGSPRALYEEGSVQPLECTILPPFQRAQWAQLDNAGTLGGSLGKFTVPEAG